MTVLKIVLVLLSGCAMMIGGFFTAIYAEKRSTKTIAKAVAILGLAVCAIGMPSAIHFLGQM